MKNKLHAHLKFTVYLCLLSIAAIFTYLKNAPLPTGMLPFAYELSTAGYFCTLLILLSALLLPASLFKWSRWITPFLGWLWLVYLAIDLTVFNLYRFHLDWLLIEMFFRDFRGMGIPTFLLVLAAVGALVALGLIIRLYHSRPFGSRKKFIAALVFLALMPAGFAVNAVINIWATHYNRDEVTQYRPYLPLFYPVEQDKSAARISHFWPALFPAEHGHAIRLSANQGGLVHYPASKPQCTVRQPVPSILMIVLESWQAESLNPTVMPRLSQFAASASRFDQHVSSGAATVPGLFGLMFGLHPNYFELFKSAPDSYPSQFTETLHQQGYQSSVFTSSNLDGFALRRLFFPHVSESNYVDALPDHELVKRLIDKLQSRSQGQANFDFMFLTSSHSPYTYPDTFARFKPLPAVEGGYALNRQADAAPYKNDYHNSLYYLDTLVSSVLSALEKRPDFRNTWIIITGDHAEEFNENKSGYWGHGSNFSKWQVQTPMIIKAPGQSQGSVETRMSLHQDIVPTLMQEALGCAGPVTDYSNGANLFHLPQEARGTVVGSYMSSAYVVDGMVLDKTSNHKYAWQDIRQERVLDDPKKIRALMQEERRFISSAPQAN